MRYSSEIKVLCSDEEEANNIMASISHEGKGSDRATARVSRKGKEISINIVSADATALRAFINSFLRDLQAIEGVEATASTCSNKDVL
ncbi:MAG: KEOPS complex subunit Pcc1 [Candidatus Bilamarchaeaceae archaeon]